MMKHLFTTLFLLLAAACLAQKPGNNSAGSSNTSLAGYAGGFIEIQNGQDKIVLDFQHTAANLYIVPDPDEMYDTGTDVYSTQTTSGKTKLTYQVYAQANILSIQLNGNLYDIGIIDGAADESIGGLQVHYCVDGKTTFLSLYVTEKLILDTTSELMQQQNLTYTDARSQAKTITILPGSNLIFTIRR